MFDKHYNLLKVLSFILEKKNIHRPAMDNLEECPADSVISASLRMNSHLTSPIVLYGYQCTPPFCYFFSGSKSLFHSGIAEYQQFMSIKIKDNVLFWLPCPTSKIAAMASDWFKNCKSLKVFFCRITRWNETKFD